MDFNVPGPVCGQFYSPTKNVQSNGKPELISLKDSDVQTELSRISCYLAGEIEVPDGTPSWEVLYGSPRSNNQLEQERRPTPPQRPPDKKQASNQELKSPDVLLKPPTRATAKRKLPIEGYSRPKTPLRTDIDFPLDWNTCFSRLWNHVTRHAIVSHTVHREAFTKRLLRMSELAKTGLRERGFFTLKNLLGPEHAIPISQWARNRWLKQPYLFRPGKLSINDSSASDIRQDMVAWIHPECPPTLAPNDSDATNLVPHVQLLFLYIDALVRSLSDSVRNRYGEWAVVNGKSWANLSSYCKQPDANRKGVGYVAHYDNPDTLCDGRILTVLYYLNPNWEQSWGGQFVLWPQQPLPTPSASATNVPTPERSKPLGILPTLDRFVLFFADQRILHCVQPVLANSPENQRLAIGIWYFDRYEREEYLRSLGV